MRRRLRTALALGLSAGVCASQQVETKGPPVHDLEAIFEQKAADEPGCAVGVFRRDSVAYSKHFGMANLELEVPVSAETSFDVASVSKQFTATAILILARRGSVSLDDDVRAHLPELSELPNKVTLRHLLHHTSGLRDHLVLGALTGKRPGAGLTRQAAMRLLIGQKTLNFPSGTQFEYSNSGYFLLGEVVERASGLSLRDFLASEVFGPLGMTRTQVGDVPSRIAPGRASGHTWRDEEPEVVRPYEVTVGSGGVLTTVSDLYRWHGALYSPSLGFEIPLIELLGAAGHLPSGEPIAYGFGLRVATYRGREMVHHGGGNGGFASHLLSFPEYELTFAALCNINHRPWELNFELADAFLGDELNPRSSSPEPGIASPEMPEPGRTDVIDLRGFVGTYHSPELEVSYGVRLDGGALTLHTAAPAPIRLEVADGDRAAAGWLKLQFTRGDDDGVDGFRLHAVRAWDIRFERMH